MFESKIIRDEPLARHTTLRIGGPADFFVRVDSQGELLQAMAWARKQHLDIFILGNGSNILVGDAGIRGLVIENHMDLEQEHVSGDILRITAESGGSLPGLANRMARRGWRGLEWAIGVPATIGAAVVTNAGAHGGSISDNLLRAEILEVRGFEAGPRWWTRGELEYDYRTSLLKRRGGEFVVIRAEFVLEQDEAIHSIARMNRYTEHRRRTQPTEPSVGSMFKNPPGDFAGRLIQAAGLKGKQVGRVQVSTVHANFFVNLGGGTAKELLELVALTQAQVHREFGIELELEIQVVGEQRG